MSKLALERCWIIGCRRCANEGTSFEQTEGDAQADLFSRGWADDYCPDCNDVDR